MIYRDRNDAGRRLAALLESYRGESPFVLALPRGGVVVGYPIAQALHAPLDVLIVRKLGAPMNPEFGFGAIAPEGARYLDSHTVQLLGLTARDIEEVVRGESAELDRRMRVYRGDRPAPELADRSVIIADDGLATGGTAKAAIRYVRDHAARRVILAVPVAPVETVEVLRDWVDELICPETPPDFHAIGQWYDLFDQTTDEEVLDLLKKNRAAQAGTNASA